MDDRIADDVERWRVADAAKGIGRPATLADVRRAIADVGRRVIEARFYVSAVTRRQGWGGSPGDDYPRMVTVVELQAAKHGTFGKSTPSGQLTMTIANPDAAQVFANAQVESLTERGQSPAFRVWFVEELPGDEG